MLKAKRHIVFLFILSALCGWAENTSSQKLTGTPIGTALSVDYNNSSQASTSVNTIADAFDGNLNTFFASWDRSKT